MTMTPWDDHALDAWLSAPDETLADGDAFAVAVMRRVRADAAVRGFEAPAALVRLQREGAALRRTAAWHCRGIAAGSALAAGAWLASGGAAALAAPQVLMATAVAGAAVFLWALTAAGVGHADY
jgi:hypothetical protein